MQFPHTPRLPCTQCLSLFIFSTLRRKSCYNSTARKLLTLTRGYLAVIVTTSDWFEVQIKKNMNIICFNFSEVQNGFKLLFLSLPHQNLQLPFFAHPLLLNSSSARWNFQNSILPAPGESFKVLKVLKVNLSLVQASAQTSHSRQRRFLVH